MTHLSAFFFSINSDYWFKNNNITYQFLSRFYLTTNVAKESSTCAFLKQLFWRFISIPSGLHNERRKIWLMILWPHIVICILNISRVLNPRFLFFIFLFIWNFGFIDSLCHKYKCSLSLSRKKLWELIVWFIPRERFIIYVILKI